MKERLFSVKCFRVGSGHVLFKDLSIFIFRHPFLNNVILLFKFVLELIRKSFLSEFIYFIYEPLMLPLVSIHVYSRLFFKVFEFLFPDDLPDSANFLHNIKGGDIRVIPYHFWSCLYVIINTLPTKIERKLTSLTKSM